MDHPEYFDFSVFDKQTFLTCEQQPTVLPGDPSYRIEPPAPTHRSFLTKFQFDSSQIISAVRINDDYVALPEGYVPDEYAVVCGRGKGSYNRIGNKRYHAIVRSHIPDYLAAKTRFDKSTILNEIIEEVKAQNNGQGRFVKLDSDGSWYEISDEQSREKCGHTMRECIASANKKKKPKPKFDLRKLPVFELPRRLSSASQNKIASFAA